MMTESIIIPLLPEHHVQELGKSTYDGEGYTGPCFDPK